MRMYFYKKNKWYIFYLYISNVEFPKNFEWDQKLNTLILGPLKNARFYQHLTLSFSYS